MSALPSLGILCDIWNQTCVVPHLLSPISKDLLNSAMSCVTYILSYNDSAWQYLY